MTRWKPVLEETPGVPLYKRIVDALAADIARGRLPPGARLPPHRELAHVLEMSVGVVTRAYDEAASRGLVMGHIGRGTYVIDHALPAAERPIDLSINVPPVVGAEIIADAVGTLRRRTALMERLTYQPPAGFESDRQAAVAWLRRTANLEVSSWQNLLWCAGAQNAMAIVVNALCTQDATILCEEATFPGMKSVAQQLRCRLHGIEMDSEGAIPEALDRAASETGARLFYTMPTLQNPTTSVMGLARRMDIVRVARAHDLWLLEDDIYACYARSLRLPPLATLAPERTFYVSSLSKIVAPGLRAGFLVAPAGDPFERCMRASRAFTHSPPGLSAAVASHLLQDGGADEIAGLAVAETRSRTAQVIEALAGLVDLPEVDASLHFALPMPEIDAERAIAQAQRSGVLLASPSAFSVSLAPRLTSLRLCVGGAAGGTELGRALDIISKLLRDSAGLEHAHI